MRQLIIILWTCFSGVGLMSCSVQNINRDVASWYPYRMLIDGVEVSFKLPPDGRIRIPPPARVDTRNIDEAKEYSTLFYVGYDSGPYSYSASEFMYICGLSRYAKLSERKRTMEELIKDTIEVQKQINEINEINAPSVGKSVTISSEVVTINERKWFNRYSGSQYDHARPRPGGESYFIPFNNTHYFSCSASYGDKIIKNEKRLADRRKLLKEIVSTIAIKQ